MPVFEKKFSCFSSNIRLETNPDTLLIKIYCRNSLFFPVNWINYLFQNSGTESTEGTEIQCLGTKIQCLSASVPSTEKKALALSRIFVRH